MVSRIYPQKILCYFVDLPIELNLGHVNIVKLEQH